MCQIPGSNPFVSTERDRQVTRQVRTALPGLRRAHSGLPLAQSQPNRVTYTSPNAKRSLMSLCLLASAWNTLLYSLCHQAVTELFKSGSRLLSLIHVRTTPHPPLHVERSSIRRLGPLHRTRAQASPRADRHRRREKPHMFVLISPARAWHVGGI